MLDPETQKWLEDEAARVQLERTEYFAKLENENLARQLKQAHELLAGIPPPLPGEVTRFDKVYDAPVPATSLDGEIQEVDGTVFEVYSVSTGQMDGSDDFPAFRVISTGDRITNWRMLALPGVKVGAAVRIRFVQHGKDNDHIDDTVFELWVAGNE